MKTSHTPGPWKVEELFDGDESLGISIKAGREEVAHISSIGQQDFDNANLMAAAPDLLEAAKEALDYLENWKDLSGGLAYRMLCRAIDKAIDKATGEAA